MGEWCDNVDWHDWHRDDNDDVYHNVKVPRDKFEPNPLHYHTYYKFKSLLMESKKAYRFELHKGGGSIWVPKSLCRHLFVTKRGKIKVWIWNGYDIDSHTID